MDLHVHVYISTLIHKGIYQFTIVQKALVSIIKTPRLTIETS